METDEVTKSESFKEATNQKPNSGNTSTQDIGNQSISDTKEIMVGINSIITMLKENNISQPDKSQTHARDQEKSKTERTVLVQNSKDILNVISYAGMTIFDELNKISCDICHHENVIKDKIEEHIEKSYGIFSYDFKNMVQILEAKVSHRNLSI